MTRSLMSLLAVVVTAGIVRAHFIWVIPTAGGEAAAVWSDSPRLDGGEPLKVNKSTVLTLRLADGRIEKVNGTGDKDVYRIACPGKGPRTLAIVRNRRSTLQKELLISQVGKAHLWDSKASAPGSEKVSAWNDLGLEILPRPDKGAEVFQVVYRGKPVAKGEVQVYRPGDADTDKVPVITADKEGCFTFAPSKGGRFGLLIEKEFDEKGTHEGKPYNKHQYTSTLVIEVPGSRERGRK